jgi:hypothetical protein
MNNDICYVIVTYGERYAGMLHTLLYSLSRTHKNPRALVIYQDLGLSCIKAISGAYDWVTVISSSLTFPSEYNRRLSSKMNAQALAFQHAQEGQLLAFIDVDVFANTEPNLDFFNTCDVAITVKNEQYPLNTGVVFLRNNKCGRAFFAEWARRNNEVIASDDLMQQAKSHILPYGAADQMALHQILRYEPDCRYYNIDVEGVSVKIKCVDCEIYNETRSVPISDKTCLYHLKGGWQPVVLDGHWFSATRPFDKCKSIYTHYINLYKSAKMNYQEKGVAGKVNGEIYIPAWHGTASRLTFVLGVVHHFCLGELRRAMSRIRHISRRVWTKVLVK